MIRIKFTEGTNQMKKKELLWATELLALSGLLIAGTGYAAASGNEKIINIVVGKGSSVATAAGPGSQAVAGGISINGRTVTADTAIRDTGVEKTEQRKLPSYHSVKIDNFPGKVVLRCNKENTAILTGDQAVLPAVKTSVENGTLFIGVTESFSTRTALEIRLNTENISSLLVDGVADVVMENIDSKQLRLELSGSGSLIASGKVGELEAILGGSGDLELGKLTAGQCTVRIDGAGDAEVHVTGLLNAEINGAGDIIYFGTPSEVLKSINGAGDIEPGVH